MTVQQTQELPGRAVIWYGIRNGSQTIKPVVPILISCEVPSEVKLRLLRVLLLIQPIRRTLPDVYLDSRNRCTSGRVSDNSVHVHHLTVIRLLEDDVTVIGSWRGIMTEEGTKDSGFCGLIRRTDQGRLRDFIDKPTQCLSVSRQDSEVKMGRAGGAVRLESDDVAE